MDDEGTLILTRHDVNGLLGLESAIAVTRDALREQSRGRTVQKAPAHLDLDDGGALRVVSGALLDTHRTGVRVTGAQALASPSGAAMLFDTRTAELLCVLAYPHGTTRTAAAMGVAIDVLATDQASRVAMLGTGRNAIGLLEAAILVRPVDDVVVYGRDAARRAEFVAAARRRITVPVREATRVENALDGADVIFVSTNSRTPVLSIGAVPSECVVAGMGAPAEFDGDLYRGATSVTVTSIEHERSFDDVWHGQMTSTLVELDAQGSLPWSDVHELGDLLDAGSSMRTGVRVFRESAGGYGDVALASYVYERALQAGLGHRVTFA